MTVRTECFSAEHLTATCSACQAFLRYAILAQSSGAEVGALGHRHWPDMRDNHRLEMQVFGRAGISHTLCCCCCALAIALPLEDIWEGQWDGNALWCHASVPHASGACSHAFSDAGSHASVYPNCLVAS